MSLRLPVHREHRLGQAVLGDGHLRAQGRIADLAVVFPCRAGAAAQDAMIFLDEHQTHAGALKFGIDRLLQAGEIGRDPCRRRAIAARALGDDQHGLRCGFHIDRPGTSLEK